MATASFTTPSSPLTMAGLAAFTDAALGELRNAHRGASAPDSPIEGQRWWDTSGGATAEILKRYTVAAGWVSILTMNVTTGTITAIHGILDEDDMASDSAVLPPSQQSVKAYADALAQDDMTFTNLNFTATVSGKALTVALKGADGNNPSATNPVTIPFRSATLTTNGLTKVSATAATSVVLSSGSTLGFTAALAGRIYVWAINNAGTVVLGLSRTADIFPEGNLVSTTAEGGAGAADSASVMYSTAAQTSKACRCIGYIEITTGATAGEWDNSPTKVQIMGPGVHRTGDIVQRVSTETGAYATGSTVMPCDDTIPQKTEGDEYMTQAITPTSAINKLIIESIWFGACSGPQVLGVALFQDATANALAAINQYQSAAFYGATIPLRHEMTAGTTSATTFKIRAGGNGAGSTYFNGLAAGGRAYGGVAASSLSVTEVFA